MKPTESTVLLVIDMQKGFLNDRSRFIIPKVVHLVEQAKRRNLPVVFTRFHNEPNGPYERLIGWTRLRASPEIDLADELAPYSESVVDKSVYTAYVADFEGLLRKNGWTRVALCGVATDGCVLKTAVDTFERGLIPVIVEDACASHAGEEVHKAGLLLIGRFVGKRQIVSTEAFLARLDEETGAT